MKRSESRLLCKALSLFLAFYTVDWYETPQVLLAVYCCATVLLGNATGAVLPWKKLASALTHCYVATVLLGGELLSLPTALITVLGAFEWTSSSEDPSNTAGTWMAVAALIGVSQYPLDWDYEVRWQEYPFPILTLMEVGHLLGSAYTCMRLRS